VAKTGIPARVFVYRVVPYLVHLSKFKGASDSSPGIPQLKQQAIKEYNYIYTGKNKDIINFDIKFNHAFFTSINGDLGQAGLDSKNSVVQETTSSGERPSPSVTEGSSNPAEIGRTQSATAKPNTVDGGIGQLHPESQIARSFNEALMNSTVDLVSVDLEILGDPYYIADSGMGNYNALQVPGILNINSDGTMNYQNGEVDIELNFRTPLDYGPTGYMDFPANGTAPVAEFSGLYQVLFVNNKFSNGQFTQTLQTIRRQSQDQSSSIPAQSLVLNTDTNANQFTGTNANPLVGSADDYGFGVTGTRNNQTSSRPKPLDGGIPVGTTTGGPSKLRQRQNAKAQQQSGPF
jgi:hypothetical protein